MTNELLKIVDKRVPVVPHYKFKKITIEDQMYKTEYLENVKDDPSYESFWKKEIIRDLKENMISVAEDPINKYV